MAYRYPSSHAPSAPANHVPGAYDEAFYERPQQQPPQQQQRPRPRPPSLAAPAPQRIVPDMSNQISEGINYMDLNARPLINSPLSPASPRVTPFPQLRNLPSNIPPTDDDFEATLESAREAVLSSNDPEMQLAWAQDALHQVDIDSEERARLQNMQVRRPPTPGSENNIKMDAMNIVTFLAEQRHPKAEYIRGTWWEFGKFGCLVDKKEAFRSYSRAADKGYARADYRIGMLYESSNDPVTALNHYHRGVEADDAACLYRLGMMTLTGQHGQRQDHVEGLNLIQRSAAAADDNAPQGAYVYGMLLAGELPQIQLPSAVLELDENLAKVEIEKAAYMRFAKAQLRMGSAYELGSLGCDFHATYSLHYYALAARQGEPEAEMGVSKWFLVGHEGAFPNNEGLAYDYAQRAALAGFANAEFAMGYFNELGIHVPKNIDVALDWYKKGAANGNADAKARIESISQKKVLSRQDHENIAIARIKSQYGSRRGQRPERFQQTNRLPSLGDGQQSQRRPPPPGSNYPSRSGQAPYPTNNGPPVLPPVGDRMPPAAPYPTNNTPPTASQRFVPSPNGGRGGPGYPVGPAPDARQRKPSEPGYLPRQRGPGPDGRPRFPSGPGPGPGPVPHGRPQYPPGPGPDGRPRYPSGPSPVQRISPQGDGYAPPASQRIVSSPAGMPSGPPRPPPPPAHDNGYSPAPGGRRPSAGQVQAPPLGAHGASRQRSNPASSQGPSQRPQRAPTRADVPWSNAPDKSAAPQGSGPVRAPSPVAAPPPPPPPPPLPTQPQHQQAGKAAPKTFDEMGVGAKKEQGECIVM